MDRFLERELSNIFNGRNKNLQQIFNERIEELNINKTQAYNAIGLDKNSIVPILDGSAKIVDTFKLMAIAEFLNLDLDDAIKIYLQDDPENRIGSLDNVRKAKFILENFELPQLKKIKFIDTISDFDQIEKRIKDFFGLDSIFDYWDEKIHRNAFSRTKRSASEKMRAFWVQVTYDQFESMGNPNTYDRNRLVELLPKIKPYTRDVENGFFTVCKALYHAGVTVIFQQHIPNTQVRGATFVVNKKPCIVITDLNKRYSTIWFALLHELFHVLYHLDEIQSRTYHLTGDPELWLENESDADQFASEYLCSKEKMEYVKPFINNEYMVKQCAEKWKIHPCIIYNTFCYENPEYWPGYGKFDPGISKSIQGVNIMALEKETVNQAIQKVKENLELI